MRTILGLRFVERVVPADTPGMKKRVKILQQQVCFIMNPAIAYSGDLIAEANKGPIWEDVPLITESDME